MRETIYYSLHVFSAFILVGVSFRAFANPDPAQRRKTLTYAGLLSLGMLIGGFGLLARLKLGHPTWVLIKMVCWLVLSAQVGVIYRKPQLASKLNFLTVALVAIALVMVYVKPF